jgi:hypothetical protein
MSEKVEKSLEKLPEVVAKASRRRFTAVYEQFWCHPSTYPLRLARPDGAYFGATLRLGSPEWVTRRSVGPAPTVLILVLILVPPFDLPVPNGVHDARLALPPPPGDSHLSGERPLGDSHLSPPTTTSTACTNP